MAEENENLHSLPLVEVSMYTCISKGVSSMYWTTFNRQREDGNTKVMLAVDQESLVVKNRSWSRIAHGQETIVVKKRSWSRIASGGSMEHTFLREYRIAKSVAD